MGWGHFSTVWMCRDSASTSSSSPSYVAMKIQKSASHYREAAFDEIELLGCIQTASKSESFKKECNQTKNSTVGVVLLLDHFEHNGPNGKHVCMIFEMLGENLLKVIKNYDYRGISIPVVQNLTKQICQGLDFLHRHCGIIHTDLKPENILIAISPPPPSALFIKSLIEQQQTTKIITQKKKKKIKNKKKKDTKQSHHNTNNSNSNSNNNVGTGTNTSGNNFNSDSKNISNVEGIGSTELSNEQKKKLKKKMKKKRQKARKSEKNKKGVKGNDENHDLPPVDELHEMTLMEKASEPITYTATTSAAITSTTTTTATITSNLPISLENIGSDDDADDDNIDDDFDEDEIDPNLLKIQNPYPRTSLSPNRSLSPGGKSIQNVKLTPLQQHPWLRQTLLSAINVRAIEFLNQPNDTILTSTKSSTTITNTSPTSKTSTTTLSLRLNESDINRILIPDGIQPSPIHLPGTCGKAQVISPHGDGLGEILGKQLSHIECEAIKIIPIPSDTWIISSTTHWSNIHMVK